MRTPVQQLRGKPRVKKETVEDALADRLSEHFKLVRSREFSYKDAAGAKQTLIVDITIPEYQLMIAIQKKQDTKGILAEIAQEKIARASGWGVCRLTEQEARGDMEEVLYKIRREIRRMENA